MDEARLAQGCSEEDVDLEVCSIEPGYWTDTVAELIAEVRRLRAENLDLALKVVERMPNEYAKNPD